MPPNQDVPCSLTCSVYSNDVSASTRGGSHSRCRQPPICSRHTTLPGVSALSEIKTIVTNMKPPFGTLHHYHKRKSHSRNQNSVTIQNHNSTIPLTLTPNTAIDVATLTCETSHLPVTVSVAADVATLTCDSEHSSRCRHIVTSNTAVDVTCDSEYCGRGCHPAVVARGTDVLSTLLDHRVQQLQHHRTVIRVRHAHTRTYQPHKTTVRRTASHTTLIKSSFSTLQVLRSVRNTVFVKDCLEMN